MKIYFMVHTRFEVILMFWEPERRPVWKIYLQDAPESVIEKTGLEKEELEKILDILHEHRIIN
jgi:hypothetical protein